MAGLGRKDFQAGAVLSAADVDGYLMDQSVMKFANTAAAGSAYGTAIAEGMQFYLSDTDEVVFHNGTSFVKQAAGENFIPNGDFSKWSRGTTAFSTGGINNADNWFFYEDGSGATTNLSRQTFSPGTAPAALVEGNYYLRYAATVAGSGGTQRVLYNKIEDVRTLAGQTVTLSFWAKADSARTLTTELSQNFGTGGSTYVSISGGSHSVTTSWSRFTATMVVPSISGKTVGPLSYLQANIFLPVNVIETIDIWGVQLEAGAVATPFKPAGGNTALDTVTSGSGGFDGVLVSTNSASNPSGSGTPAWAGYDVAGKNKIINGGFDFWQRGTTFNSATSGTWLADRWVLTSVSGTQTVNVSRQQFGAGSKSEVGTETAYYMRIARTLSTSGDIYLDHRIEDVRTFAGETVTLSFWARVASGTLTPSRIFLNQNFGSGGSAEVDNIGAFSPTFTTSFQKFTTTINVSSISGKTVGTGSYLRLLMQLPSALGNFTLDIANVQLEVGSVATPFSRAGGTLQGELAACQRYYQRSTADNVYAAFAQGVCYGTTAGRALMPLPVQMRVAPTSIEYSNLTVYDGFGHLAVTGLSLDTTFSNKQIASGAWNVASGAVAGRVAILTANNTTNSYLAFNAEL